MSRQKELRNKKLILRISRFKSGSLKKSSGFHSFIVLWSNHWLPYNYQISYYLRNRLQLPLVRVIYYGDSNKQRANTTKHCFLGAISCDKMHNTNISHISDLFEGTAAGDDDDLTELLMSVTPWKSFLIRDATNGAFIDRMCE